MDKKQFVYDALAGMGLSYRVVEHPAVFRAEEMMAIEFPPDTVTAKNLFLRDAKGKRHFLVVAEINHAVDLRRLEQPFGCSRLSFASEERLQKYMGLTKGSVSPFGLLNDPEHHVELFLDAGLRDAPAIGFHPNDNTATVFLSYQNLIRFFQATGHVINLVELSSV